MERQSLGQWAADEHFNVAMQNHVVDHFVVHQLLRLARSSDGDFDSLIIHSLLSLQASAGAVGDEAALPALEPQDLLPARLLRAPGLRSSEIAQLTGIPRETVRRKLERMQVKGRVQRHETGRWAVMGPPPADRRQMLNETARNVCVTAERLRQFREG